MNSYKSKWMGHLAVFLAYLIFGLNIIVCKDLTSSGCISPIGLFLLRSIGAGAIFWILSLMLPAEKIEKKDYVKIFWASFLGFFLTQITFLTAIPLITPMESAMMSSLSPIYTMFIAAVAVHEPITSKKVLGVAISFVGIIYLIFTGMSGGFVGGESNMLGILLMVGNALSFSLYLGIFRPLIEKYQVVTFMKWIFLFSMLMSLPFGIPALMSVDYSAIQISWMLELGFLIVFATFVAYFLIPFAQKIIRPTLVSMYSYVQPIVAIAISVAIGMDQLTLGKIIATFLVFGGVYIVSRSKSASHAKVAAKSAIVIVLLFSFSSLQAADTMTGMLNSRVKSLQIEVEGSPMSPPVIMLNSNDRLIISFDHLSEDREYLRYELIHCNANWQPSQLVDTEFLDGFNQGTVEYYDFSQMTTTHYVHYEIVIPNEEVSLKVSGNYLLRVYPENDPEDIWLQCRFMVTEQSALIDAELTSRTDVDFNKKHQQLSIVLDTERSNVADPFNDVKVYVQQNGRYDNEVLLDHPLRMNSRKISVYEHQPQLIFEAGNEYRRFETVSVNYPTMGVDYIDYLDPYYHFTLQVDEPRTNNMYLYDQTQHGRYLVREYNSIQSDIEADYVVVHFALDMPEQEDAMIFVDGDFVARRFDPESLMTYNRATGLYERAMLLKQGAYNYQYLVVPKGKSRGYTDPIEGDKYQTSNEYLIKVYARNPGERYDRLIGVSVLR